ncbi:MAG: hypothetical protein HC926_05770 [Synechococcaceae cyanobacterium SM2_3_60]|nr:hypothetical protein [Synechococcaceae cyanobacterium SM2_3_60]
MSCPSSTPSTVISAGLAPVTLPLQFGGDVIQESLEIQLADQIVPTLGERLARLSRRDRLTLLEPAASRLLIAAEIQRLQARHPDLAPMFTVAAEAERAITDLQTLQAANGGFRPWAESGDYTQPFLSAYAARAIAAAERAGIVVPPPLRDRLQSYLQGIANNPSDCPGCTREQRLEALLGLAELGQRRPDLMASLYADREQLSDLGQIKLAHLLSRDPNWQIEAALLTTSLSEVTYNTGRAASLNLPTSWQWYGSATAAQAELLQLLVQQDANADQLQAVAQGLMDLQREGAWPSLYDNAVALSALANYQPNRDISEATVSLGSETLGTFSFPGRYSLSRTDLPRGSSELRIDSDGELPYLAAYSYSLPGPQPGRLQGIRVTRTLQPANSREPIATLGLRQPTEPINLPVGAIFDVGRRNHPRPRRQSY